jgi:thioredoxin 1
MVEQITDSDFAKAMKGKAVVDFYADWCGPCKMISPVIEKLSKEMKDIRFCKVDVDNNQEYPEKFGVRSIPTVIFLKDGKEVERVVGFLQEVPFRQLVKKAFG